jgi:hypothetical protein
MSRRSTRVAATLACAALASQAAPATASAAAQRTHLSEAVVAIDRGNAVIAGFDDGRVVLARLDSAGRLIGRRSLGRAKRAGDLRVDLSGSRVAVAWLEGQDAIVLRRTGLRGGSIRRDRLSGRNVLFHELAMNERGTVVDAFKDSPDGDDSGVAAYVARPGERARNVPILAPTERNPNNADVEVDATGGFHVSWSAYGSDDHDVLGSSDGDVLGAFGAPAEQDLGSSLAGVQVRTAADGGQLAAYQRRSADGEFLLVVARRAAGAAWQAPVVVRRVGANDAIQELAVTPAGDGLLSYGPWAGGLIRAVVLPAAGGQKLVGIGRGVLEGVTTDAHGHVRVAWTIAGRTSRFVTANVSLPGGEVAAPRTAASGCFGEIDDDRSDRFDADAGGRGVAVLACGRRQRAAVVRFR